MNSASLKCWLFNLQLQSIILHHWLGELVTIKQWVNQKKMICQLSNPLLFFAISDESFGFVECCWTK